MSGSSTSGYDGHCLIMSARHLFEAIGPRRVYHRRSKMKPRGGRKCKPKWSQKWLQNGSKMAQFGPGSKKFGSGSELHQFWVPFGPPFGVQNRAWNAPRATRRPISASWRVPGRALGAHFGELFGCSVGGSQKKPKTHPQNNLF